MRTKARVDTDDGISWYYEQEGTGPDLVLIPDGFGECGLFDRAIPRLAAAGLRVTTMDMPGFSRSATGAPKESYTAVTGQNLAAYVVHFLDAIGIERAAFWGCSSGGSTVLALVVDHPARVRNVMAHEVPTLLQDFITISIPDPEDDDAVARYMIDTVLASTLGDDAAQASWTALGDEIHDRLYKNFPVWARGYPATIPHSAPLQALKRRRPEQEKWPIDWTVGFESQIGVFYENAVTAGRAGIDFGILPGRHFPYVTHVDEFVAHVVETCRKYLS